MKFRVGRSPLPCPARPGNPKGWRGVLFPGASLLAGTERDSAPIAARRFLALPASVVPRSAPRTISTQSRKGRRARKDFLGRALAKPVRERPWLKSYLWRDQPRTNTDALRLRLRKFPRGGATAPNQGTCRGRASRGRDEPNATLKRASCVVGPVARPSAAPADWEGCFAAWESWEVIDANAK